MRMGAKFREIDKLLANLARVTQSKQTVKRFMLL